MTNVAQRPHATPSAVAESAEPFGRYVLLGRLASGGMADVYAAQHATPARLRRRVAIKRIRPHLIHNRAFVQMFLEEARISSRLSHRNVCQVYEFGQADGEYYLAMEYLHGVTLSMLAATSARRGQRLPISVVIGILAQACEGLHHAHERRDVEGNSVCVAHRDVSPQNLLIRDDGVVKVLDFGVAKTERSGQRTNTSDLKGKDSYMSPEQLEGRRLDRRTDVWSLGVVLFESLSGAKMFRRGSLMETAYAITQQPIPNLKELCPEVPDALVQVVSRALCRDRDQRYASANMLREALLDAVGPRGFATNETIGSFVRDACAPVLRHRDHLFDSGNVRVPDAAVPLRRSQQESGTTPIEQYEFSQPVMWNANHVHAQPEPSSHRVLRRVLVSVALTAIALMGGAGLGSLIVMPPSHAARIVVPAPPESRQAAELSPLQPPALRPSVTALPIPIAIGPTASSPMRPSTSPARTMRARADDRSAPPQALAPRRARPASANMGRKQRAATYARRRLVWKK